MSDSQTCPNHDQLQAMLAGTLDDVEQDTISRHVESCESCQQTLEQLAATSWDEKAKALDQHADEPDEALREVLVEAQDGMTVADESGPSAHGDDEMSFLEPTENPKHLGRFQHYEIIQLLGKGGFGYVFKAIDETLDRTVALKMLAPQLAANGTARRRFEREAKAAAAVSHDHVVTIHAVVGGDIPYLVMECVVGRSLEQRLDADGPLDVKEILRIGNQVGCGLEAAHKQGLVHRDIKPANILLENGVERVKITDFGLARAIDDASLTQSGVITGTPMYMSPEQARGESLDHRADLFSLGSVLYAMCTGRPPFRASGTMAVLKRVCDDAPRPIREINPDIPEWLCDIVVKLHAKKPYDRFQTASEVAELLEKWLAYLQQPDHAARPAPIKEEHAAADVAQSADEWDGFHVLARIGLCAAIIFLWFPWSFSTRNLAGAVGRVVRIELGFFRPVQLSLETGPDGFWFAVSAVRALPLVVCIALTLIALYGLRHTFGSRRARRQNAPNWSQLHRPVAAPKTVAVPESASPTPIRSRRILARPLFGFLAILLSLGIPLLLVVIQGINEPRFDLFGGWTPVVAILLALASYFAFEWFFEPRPKTGVRDEPSGTFRILRRIPAILAFLLLVAVTFVAILDGTQQMAGPKAEELGAFLYIGAAIYLFVFTMVSLVLRRMGNRQAQLWPGKVGWLVLLLFAGITAVFVEWVGEPWDEFERVWVQYVVRPTPYIEVQVEEPDLVVKMSRKIGDEWEKGYFWKQGVGRTKQILEPGWYTLSAWLKGVIIHHHTFNVIPGQTFLWRDRSIRATLTIDAQDQEYFERSRLRIWRRYFKSAGQDAVVLDWEPIRHIEKAGRHTLQLMPGAYRIEEYVGGKVATTKEVRLRPRTRESLTYVGDGTVEAMLLVDVKPDYCKGRQVEVHIYREIWKKSGPGGNVNTGKTVRVRAVMGPQRLAMKFAPGHYQLKEYHDGKLAETESLTLTAGATSAFTYGKDENSSITALNAAVLLLDFEKDHFYQKDGKTYVRDLSGRGNDGLCAGVQFTPNGKLGGGLISNGKGNLQLAKSLINQRSEFTIAAWMRIDKIPPLGCQFYSVKPKGAPNSKTSSFHVILQPGAHVYSGALNEDGKPDMWAHADTDSELFNPGEWFFLAVRLDNGAIGKGRYRITVGEKTLERSLQTAKNTQVVELVDVIFFSSPGVLDDLRVWTRALTDEEIAQLKDRGLLQKGVTPPKGKESSVAPPQRDAVTFRKHRGYVFGLAFHPKGDWVVTGGNDETLRVWEPRTGKELFTIDTGVWINSVAVNPKGDRIVVGTGANNTGVYDLKGNRVLRLQPTDPGTNVAYSPDGKHIATGGSLARVRLWDATTGKEIRSYKGGAKTIHQIAFSPDGKNLAIASGAWDGDTRKAPGEVVVWDIDNEAAKFHLKGHTTAAYGVAFSPNGELLASAGGVWSDEARKTVGGEVRFWNPKTGAFIRSLRAHVDQIRAIAFSPDGKYLVTGADDYSVRVWKPRDEKHHDGIWDEVRLFRSKNWQSARVAVSPGNTIVASADRSGFGVHLWALDPKAKGVFSSNFAEATTATAADQLHGVWSLIRAEMDGKPLPIDGKKFPKAEIRFGPTGFVITAPGEKKKITGTYRIDEQTRKIILEIKDSGKKTPFPPMSYRLDAGQLTIDVEKLFLLSDPKVKPPKLPNLKLYFQRKPKKKEAETKETPRRVFGVQSIRSAIVSSERKRRDFAVGAIIRKPLKGEFV